MSLSLSAQVFELTVVPRQPLHLPRENKGNTLRGAFGTAFRRLVCVPQCRNARECPLSGSCPYKVVFEPSPPPSADRLSKNQDAPRPFVFRPPLTDQTIYQPGERFRFGLVLIGSAIDYLPYFVLALREVMSQGFGLNRAACDLEEVKTGGLMGQEPSCVYRSSEQRLHNPEPMDLREWIEWRLRALDPARITIRFLTPTYLKYEERPVLRPDFHHLFKRVRDRVNALSTFYGPDPIDADFKALGEAAEKVRTVKCDVHWVERFRTSSKTRQRHELSGFVGECTYEFPERFAESSGGCGDSEISSFDLMEWLLVGELLGAGRHAAFGNGWYELGS